MFEFADLLDEYAIPLVLYPKPGGHNEHGAWVPDNVEPVDIQAPLVPPTQASLKSGKLQYEEGGMVKSYDAVLYSTMNLEVGSKIENPRNSQTYEVGNMIDNFDYADTSIYGLKGVSNHGQQRS